MKKYLIQLTFFSTLMCLISCGQQSENTQESNDLRPNTNSVQESKLTEDIKELRDELYKAIKKTKDTSIVEHTISKLDSLEFLFENGETPLTLAIKKSKDEISAVVLENSKNLLLLNKNGETPLNIAISYRNVHIIELMINRNMNLDFMGKNNPRALEQAIKSNSEQIIIMLLKAGADFNFNIDGKSFTENLKLKNFNRAYRLAGFLNRSKDTKSNQEILTLAVSSSDIDIFKYAISLIDSNQKLGSADLLIQAIDISNKNTRNLILNKLLDLGIDPNDIDSESPLIYSVKNSKESAAKILLTNGSNLFVQDDFKMSPLDYAVSNLNYKLVKYMIATVYLPYKERVFVYPILSTL